MSRIVDLARGWIGTPYVHQAACKGAGCDCLGLLRGVWAEATGAPLIAVPPYSADWSEPQGEERLWQGVSALLRPAEGGFVPGEVVLFRMRRGAVAKHLGILSCTGGDPKFIHSYQGHGVIESRLTLPWQRRLVARFSAPEIG